eukprot:372213_1
MSSTVGDSLRVYLLYIGLLCIVAFGIYTSLSLQHNTAIEVLNDGTPPQDLLEAHAPTNQINSPHQYLIPLDVDKAQQFMKTDLSRQNRNVAIAFGFNYKADTQRKTVIQPEDYIELWYNSVHKCNMKGVILGNLFDDAFIARYSTEQVQFVTIDPDSHPSFTQVENNTAGQYDYALITDLQDVEFLNNPFDYMDAMDKVMGTPQIYAGDEYGQLYNKWLDKRWTKCLGEQNHNFRHMIFNSGILGAEVNTLLPFLDKMIKLFEKVPVKHLVAPCDMPVFSKVIFGSYQADVIHGYPLHTKFRHGLYGKIDPLEVNAYIKHK